MKKKKILNLVLLLLAVLFLVSGVIFMAAGLTYTRNNTEEMGVTVLYAKQYIPAGTVFTDENVGGYVGAKTVKAADAVPSAITVGGSSKKNMLDTVVSVFFTEQSNVPADALQVLTGMQAVTGISENVQLEAKYFLNEAMTNDERLFSIPMDYKLGMGGEIQVGDLVDLWVFDGETAEKIFVNARVYKLKGDNNTDITPESKEKPVLAIFKMTDDAIAKVREAQNDGSVFLVKHGVQV